MPGDTSATFGTDSFRFAGSVTDSLQTVNRMKIRFNLYSFTFQPGDSIEIPFALQNPYDYEIDFNHKRFPVEVCLVFSRGEAITVQHASLNQPVNIIPAGATFERILVSVIPALTGGEYKLGICLNNKFGPSLNSRFVKIKAGYND